MTDVHFPLNETAFGDFSSAVSDIFNLLFRVKKYTSINMVDIHGMDLHCVASYDIKIQGKTSK